LSFRWLRASRLSWGRLLLLRLLLLRRMLRNFLPVSLLSFDLSIERRSLRPLSLRRCYLLLLLRLLLRLLLGRLLPSLLPLDSRRLRGDCLRLRGRLFLTLLPSPLTFDGRGLRRYRLRPSHFLLGLRTSLLLSPILPWPLDSRLRNCSLLRCALRPGAHGGLNPSDPPDIDDANWCARRRCTLAKLLDGVCRKRATIIPR
jgi:hypothetical protein